MEITDKLQKEVNVITKLAEICNQPVSTPMTRFIVNLVKLYEVMLYIFVRDIVWSFERARMTIRTVYSL